MTTVKVELPDPLYQALKQLVERGWYSSEGDLVQEAIRRFLEARTPALTSRFIAEDVEWGLRGND